MKSREELSFFTQTAFTERFKQLPSDVFFGAGRINILGEHVDYNDGFVLPASIDRYICMCVAPASERRICIAALDLDQEAVIDLDVPLERSSRLWVNYFLGVLDQVSIGNQPAGLDIAFSSNIPMGAGLSSSAALESCFCLLLDSVYGLGLSREQMALIGQKAEHTFVGVNCGIMDQFASVFGKKDLIVKVDCNNLDYEYFPADFGDYSLLLLDSCVKHSHLESGYNDRRKDVEEGLAILRARFGPELTFRDCTPAMLSEVKPMLNPVVFKRCHYVIGEIARVEKAVAALSAGDTLELGRLMFETHRGLSEDYEVSCEEMDFLADLAQKEDGICGARMMGGGFGGCTINLIRTADIPEIVGRISQSYLDRFGHEPKVYPVSISEGTHKAPK